MRAGVRLDRARWIAVVVDARGEIAAEHEQSSDADDGVAEVLGWLARHAGHALQSVTFDVSAMLRPEEQPRVVAIRIAPRPAVDAIHELRVSPELAGSVRGTVHVAGGHDMRGRQLTDLGLAGLACELDSFGSGALVASVAAVGSIANPEHEERVADAILAAFPDARISLSHEFFSNALRDRDYTSTANAALLRSSERLAARIEQAAGRQLPGVAIAFGLGDGGRAPIRRLSTTPVHAMHAGTALCVQGARHLAGVEDGDLVVVSDDSTIVAHVHHGVPAANTLVKRGREPSLASNTARIDDHSPALHSELIAPVAVVDARRADAAPGPGLPEPTIRAEVDLGALGAAVAPLSSWADYLGHATSAAGLQGVLRSTEEELLSQTIHWGAGPDATRVVESNAYTLAYGSRHVVRIRVRVIGDWVDARVPVAEPIG